MAEIANFNSSKRKNTFSKIANRRSTRVDLTPMVDLGFLLITFFVFTTSMAQPKVMNLMEPMHGETQVPQSGAMTIILDKNRNIFYYYSILDEKSGLAQMQTTNFQSIRSLILKMKNQTEISKLMFIIKANNNSTFGDSIDLLDEMSICNIPPGHYSEVDITRAESEIIESLN